jgi:2-keto-4-pentenoate hydratase/2-oxohepta-3-ene-1,7-dioic acid hydratase in catechol pathway
MEDIVRTPPPAILAIGRNYAAHAAEMRSVETTGSGGAVATAPAHPTVFMKNPASVIGDGEPIVISPVCREPEEQVDYEGELAVVLARDARDVPAGEALGWVAGYAAANDVSARWWQKKGSGGQFVRGKSFDTFCPIGAVVPAATVPDPQDLRLVTRLNGDVVQDGHTRDMIFPVAHLIAELSRGTTLLAGTVILTGTPAGVGAARTPPRFLRAGDVVEIAIDGVGVLRNPVAAC